MKAMSVFVLSVFLALPAGIASASDITVSGAASLTNAFTEVKGAFEKAHPDIHVATNFAASNPLLQQMREGAPVDVFASADQDTMNKAEQEKLIDPATRRNFVANSLVLIVPLSAKDNGPVKNAADLSKAKRIAVGNPDSVPAGRYARASLQSLGQWRGEADAGFVYATDAFIAKDKVAIVDTMSGHEPILYPVAVTSSAKDKAAAQAFVDYLFAPEGRAILANYGFSEAK